MSDVQKLTEIDLSDLQIGEQLTIYRGSSAFLTGPGAAGYVGDATVIEVKKRSALLTLKKDPERDFVYRLRFKDARICRVPNGEPTMLYVHARTGRPTVTAYFTDAEYELVKMLLRSNKAESASSRHRRWSTSALERMEFHDRLRSNGGRIQ
jgi:hypothetical protein